MLGLRISQSLGRGDVMAVVEADSRQGVMVMVMVYCTVLYCTVLYCGVLYSTVMVLYCTVLYLVRDDAHAEAWLLHGSLHPPLVQPGVIHLDTAARSDGNISTN